MSGGAIKPLVWTPRGDGAQWYAKCPNDRFHYTALPQFREELDGQWMTYLDDIWRPYPTLEAAKAAAQADYEARIRSCLIDVPADVPAPAPAADPVRDALVDVVDFAKLLSARTGYGMNPSTDLQRMARHLVEKLETALALAKGETK